MIWWLRVLTIVYDRNWTLMKQGLPGTFQKFSRGRIFWEDTNSRAYIDVPTWQEFLYKVKNINPEIPWSILILPVSIKNLDPSTKIGIDPTLISACTWLRNRGSIYVICCWRICFLANAETLGKDLSSKGSELVPLSQNLVDAIWEDRPARPASLVFHLDEKYSGIITFSPPPLLSSC